MNKTTTKVVNIHTESYDVYIGRPSKWCNPFAIKNGSSKERVKVIEKYRKWIMKQHELLDSLDELKNKKLGCYCSPKPCHGDVLVELVEKFSNDEEEEF